MRILFLALFFLVPFALAEEEEVNDPNYETVYHSTMYFGGDFDVKDFIPLENQDLPNSFSDMKKGRVYVGFDFSDYAGLEIFYEVDNYKVTSTGFEGKGNVAGAIFNIYMDKRALFNVDGAVPYFGLGYGYNFFDFEQDTQNNNYHVVYTRLGVQFPLQVLRINAGLAANKYTYIDSGNPIYLENNTSQVYFYLGFDLVIPLESEEVYVGPPAGQEQDAKSLLCLRSSFQKPRTSVSGSDF